MISRKLFGGIFTLSGIMAYGSYQSPNIDSSIKFSQEETKNHLEAIIYWNYENPVHSKQIKKTAKYWDTQQQRLILEGYPIEGWSIYFKKENKEPQFGFNMDYEIFSNIIKIYQQNQMKNSLKIVNFPAKNWTLMLNDLDGNNIPEHFYLAFPEEDLKILEEDFDKKLSQSS